MSEALYNFRQAARILTVKPSTIRYWTSRRMIPFIRIGGRAVRFRQSDLDAFIGKGERPALRPPGEPKGRGSKRQPKAGAPK